MFPSALSASIDSEGLDLAISPPSPEAVTASGTVLEASLKQYFGYDRFRPGQREIIQANLQSQDQLVIMPTGGGKSLCFQLPALLKSGLTIVVSPLIALMQDQVDALNNNGIAATFLNSSVTSLERRDRVQAVLAGQLKLLYVAPERLLSEPFLELLDQVQATSGLSGLAIDEAHCVSEWGHDFRPEYRQLRQMRQRYPQVPIQALTATATQRVRQDIIQQLELANPYIHVASFNRPNLYYEVRPKNRRSYGEILQHLRQENGSGIIYCMSRKTVDELSGMLQKDGIRVAAYHAGLSDQERRDNQKRFIRDDVQVMVATIAFGMGINKPDVRFVIHYDLPRNLETYYQESGRAGRDGEPAQCILFFAPQDIYKVDWLIQKKSETLSGQALEREQQIARQQLRQMIDYAESALCRRTVQLSYFGEVFAGNCEGCDNCRYPKPVVDWTIEAQKFLSCVARCQERFGMTHIIDVLRGAKSQKILQKGHDRLSTYGIGKDRNPEQWRLLGRTLIQQGLLEETTDGYPVLRLNEASWQVLRKQRSVLVSLPTEKQTEKPIAVDQPFDEALFQRLRNLRKQLADQAAVPPYVVFADSSLRQMVQQQPQTLTAFARISGVGERKLKQYGDRFIAEITAYRRELGLPLHLEEPPPEPSAAPADRSSLREPTHAVTLMMYRQGYSLEDIAAQRDLKLTTIVSHMVDLLQQGSLSQADLDQWVEPERQAAIVRALETLEPDTLTPLRQSLGESYSFEEIKLVRAHWRYRTANLDYS